MILFNTFMPKVMGSTVIRSLGPDDLKGCVELAVDVGWWPERAKWALLLAGSDGWAIDAPDGRGLAGSVILTRWGATHGAIGMMLTARRYRGYGFGRALMEHALDAADPGMAVSLYATDAGNPLYTKLGFKPVRRNIAHRGPFRVIPPAKSGKKGAPADAEGAPGTVRAATEADLPAILKLDRAAYGADREHMISRMPGFAQRIVVFEASEGITGWAAMWRTEPFMHIGPLIAADGAAARRLVTSLAAHSTVPVRLDLDPDRPEMPAWAAASGLKGREHTVLMTWGDRTPVGIPEHVYTPISVACA
jgi:GNAT superfamily N-acetyltransferase